MITAGSLDGIILRITTRYTNLYPYDVYVEKSYAEGPYNATAPFTYVLKGGFAVDLFLNLKEYLKFRYILVPQVGTYNFSSAKNESIDIFVGSYSLLPDRAQLVDATFVTGQSKIVAFVNHDFEGSNEILFTLPFSRALWCGIAIFLSLSYIVVRFFGRMEKLPSSSTNFHFLSVVLLKSSSITFHEARCRMVFLIISVSVMTFMISYSSNMISMKAVKRFELNSLESIVESRYKILLELGMQDSSIRVILEALTHIPVIAILLKRIVASQSDFHTFEEAIQMVQQSPSAYIIDEETGIQTIDPLNRNPGEEFNTIIKMISSWVDMVYGEIGYFPCSWSTISVFNLKYPWVFYMKKNSPFKDSINYGLLRLDEVGLTKRLRQKWLPHADECKDNSVSTFESISLHQIYHAFVILVIGALMSIAWIIVVEKHYCVTLRNIRRHSESV